ncbi:Leucine-rich repeat-containing protein 61 [Intoshia linei]|uniref:Leucine-rich repeat-containing protein 61 n=1 Tax=Intoshia linei TaxID=1819745 RepID=A0A177AZM5_9BILA|nr:Leucine-rich repeat-containing protein 61 [Intoshia linei]
MENWENYKINKIDKYVLRRIGRTFDVGCIYALDISGQNLRNLGEINLCIELKYLDASKNKLESLGNVSKLKKLEHFDLHNNELSKLEGIGNLTSLISLNLSGNRINKIESLHILRKLNLKRLILRNRKSKLTNPFILQLECNHSETDDMYLDCYKSVVANTLPNVKFLDGIPALGSKNT